MAHITMDEDFIPVKEQKNVLPQYATPEEVFQLKQMKGEELWEKYVAMRDNFLNLKKFTRKQEDKIMRLQTKLRKIISDRKQGNKTDSETFRIQNIDLEQEIQSLQFSNSELETRNKNLEAKLKVANVQLSSSKKTRIPLLYRHVSPQVDSGLKTKKTKSLTNLSRLSESDRRRSSNLFSVPSSFSESVRNHTAVHEPVHNPGHVDVRPVLEEARQRILELEEDQEKLLQQISETQQASEEMENELYNTITSLRKELDETRETNRDRGVRETEETSAFIRAKRENRALKARATALQEQFHLTDSKMLALRMERESLDRSVEKIAAELTEKEAIIETLRTSNRKTLNQLNDADKEKELLLKQTMIIKSENDKLTALKSDERPLEKAPDKDTFRKEFEEMRSFYETVCDEKANILLELIRCKETIYSKEKEIEDLKVALESSIKCHLEERSFKDDKQMKNDTFATELVDRPEVHLNDEIRLESLSASQQELQKRFQELQMLYREKKIEVEKMSSIVDGHADTFKHLSLQKDAALGEFELKETRLLAQLRAKEDSLQRKENTCLKLENQLLTLKDQTVITKGLPKESLENYPSSLRIGKHDNVLELDFQRISFVCPDVFEGIKLFMSWLLPFAVDDPLQHTNVVLGPGAHFRHSSLYKLQLNTRNLTSIHEDLLIIGVYVLLDSGHPVKIGEAKLSLKELLERPRNALLGTTPVMRSPEVKEEESLKGIFGADCTPSFQRTPSSDDECVLGALQYKIRLQRDCQDVIVKYFDAIARRCAIAPENEPMQCIEAPLQLDNLLPADALSQRPTPVPRKRAGVPNSPVPNPEETGTNILTAPIDIPALIDPSPESSCCTINEKEIESSDSHLSMDETDPHTYFEESAPAQQPSCNESCSDVILSEQKYSSQQLPSSAEIRESDSSSEIDDDSLKGAGESPFYCTSTSTTSLSDGLTVGIIGLKLPSDSKLLDDPAVEFVFVDYHGFLGLPPEDLETPTSLPKPPPNKIIRFDFINRIEVDKSIYPERWTALKSRIEQKIPLKFTLISEPPEHLQNEQDCRELGHTTVDLASLVNRKETYADELPVYDDHENIIATLFLSITLNVNL